MNTTDTKDIDIDIINARIELVNAETKLKDKEIEIAEIKKYIELVKINNEYKLDTNKLLINTIMRFGLVICIFLSLFTSYFK